MSDNSLTMAENWVFGALIVTSTMPLESEILASLRTLDAFLGYGDIIMVVDDKDGPLAYDVLQREIQGSHSV